MSKIRNSDDVELMRRYARVERRLRHAWWRQRAHAASRGMGLLLLAAIALLAVDFLLDWRMQPGTTARTALLAVNAVVLAAVFYLFWVRRLRRYDPVHVALNVERLHPKLQSLLVSYVQLHSPEGLENEQGISPSLVRAMCRQADEQAAPINFGKIIHFRTLTRLTIFCLLTVAAALAVIYIQPVMFEVFARRMLNPASTLRYPTQTHIYHPPTNETIQQGSHVLLSIIAGGEVPNTAVLVMEPDEGSSEEQVVPVVRKDTRPGDAQATTQPAATQPAAIAYTPLPRGEASLRLLDVMRSFSYYFRVGDTQTRRYRVEVIPPPAVELRATLKYPEYLKLAPKESDILSVRMPEGSTIEWQLKSDRPLAKVAMTADGSDPATMDLDDAGTVAAGAATPKKNFSYGFAVTDREHGFKYILDVRYMVQVVPDRAPRVSLVAPTRDEKATEQKEVQLTYSAGDDYGLAKTNLVYTIYRAGAEKPDPEQTHEIQTFEDSPRSVPGRYDWTLQKWEKNLKPGDVIQYAVEVVDNRAGTGNPGVGRSEQRRISIVSVDEYLQWAMEERKRIFSGIKEAREQEVRSAETVSDLSQDGKEKKNDTQP